MNKSRTISFGLAIVFLASPGVAFAECQRTGTLICGTGAPHFASDAPLEVSRGGDFAAITSGTTLKGGDRVLVGSADATLSLGSSCQAPVSAGSLVSIRGNGAKTCVSVTEQAAQMNGVVEDQRPAVNPLVVGGIAAAGAAAIIVGVIVSNQSSGPVSSQ